MPKKKTTCFHVLLVGDKNVGKYSLAEQFIKGWIAPKDFQAPPGSTSKVLVIEKKKVEVTVSYAKDFENGEEMEKANGIMLVYNISDKKSLEYIHSQASTLLGSSSKKDGEADGATGEQQTVAEKGKTFDKPLVLVGNKADEAKLSRKVTVEDGKKVSEELDCAGFFETSATCNENVPKAFRCLVDKMLEKHIADNPATAKRKKSNCVIS